MFNNYKNLQGLSAVINEHNYERINTKKINHQVCKLLVKIAWKIYKNNIYKNNKVKWYLNKYIK